MRPEDASCDGAYRYDQFAVGEDVISAPFMTPMEDGIAKRDVWLPQGEWVADNGEHFVGPCTIEVQGDLGRMPHFFRAGAIIPEGDYKASSQDPQETLRLRLYMPKQDGIWERVLFEDDGESLAIDEGFVQLNCRRDGVETVLQLADNAHSGVLQRAIEILVHVEAAPGSITLNSQSLAESETGTGWTWRHGLLTIRREADASATEVKIAVNSTEGSGVRQ